MLLETPIWIKMYRHHRLQISNNKIKVSLGQNNPEIESRQISDVNTSRSNSFAKASNAPDKKVNRVIDKDQIDYHRTYQFISMNRYSSLICLSPIALTERAYVSTRFRMQLAVHPISMILYQLAIITSQSISTPFALLIALCEIILCIYSIWIRHSYAHPLYMISTVCQQMTLAVFIIICALGNIDRDIHIQTMLIWLILLLCVCEYIFAAGLIYTHLAKWIREKKRTDNSDHPFIRYSQTLSRDPILLTRKGRGVNRCSPPHTEGSPSKHSLCTTRSLTKNNIVNSRREARDILFKYQ